MNYYYITGTSSGIGKEIATRLLKHPTNKIIGISRKTTITHVNYKHVQLDLSNLDSVAGFKFFEHAEAHRICLINNAGTLGEVIKTGKLSTQTIIKSYNVNLVAPSILCNAFINFYNSSTAEKIILNVSSGAGKHPLDGWSVYCASKAALDMFTRVVDEEQKLTGANAANKNGPFKIMSVAPGKVDTPMQAEIRKSAKEDFSQVQYFIDAKMQNQLLSPEAVAQKYVELLENTSKAKEAVFSLKNV